MTKVNDYVNLTIQIVCLRTRKQLQGCNNVYIIVNNNKALFLTRASFLYWNSIYSFIIITTINS